MHSGSPLGTTCSFGGFQDTVAGSLEVNVGKSLANMLCSIVEAGMECVEKIDALSECPRKRFHRVMAA